MSIPVVHVGSVVRTYTSQSDDTKSSGYSSATKPPGSPAALGRVGALVNTLYESDEAIKSSFINIENMFYYPEAIPTSPSLSSKNIKKHINKTLAPSILRLVYLTWISNQTNALKGRVGFRFPCTEAQADIFRRANEAEQKTKSWFSLSKKTAAAVLTLAGLGFIQVTKSGSTVETWQLGVALGATFIKDVATNVFTLVTTGRNPLESGKLESLKINKINEIRVEITKLASHLIYLKYVNKVNKDLAKTIAHSLDLKAIQEAAEFSIGCENGKETLNLRTLEHAINFVTCENNDEAFADLCINDPQLFASIHTIQSLVRSQGHRFSNEPIDQEALAALSRRVTETEKADFDKNACESTNGHAGDSPSPLPDQSSETDGDQVVEVRHFGDGVQYYVPQGSAQSDTERPATPSAVLTPSGSLGDLNAQTQHTVPSKAGQVSITISSSSPVGQSHKVKLDPLPQRHSEIVTNAVSGKGNSQRRSRAITVGSISSHQVQSALVKKNKQDTATDKEVEDEYSQLRPSALRDGSFSKKLSLVLASPAKKTG